MSARLFLALLLSSLVCVPALADSSSPQLAAYYDRQMAIVAGKVYAWKQRAVPAQVAIAAQQVGVARDKYYVLANNGNLITFEAPGRRHTVLMRGVKRFAAGDSGVLAITIDYALWWLSAGRKTLLANGVVAAAVGDGANYYVTRSGDLFVRGRAHRGQYGDGRLTRTEQFVRTAFGVVHVTAHTGHAILLLDNGDVMGTGGNIFGPVGKHGLGDKAVRWSKIMSGAKAVATGSSHSLAIRKDGTLVAWGRGYGSTPKRVMSEVVAVAAGSRTTIALKSDGTLWQWERAQNPAQVRLPAKN